MATPEPHEQARPDYSRRTCVAGDDLGMIAIVYFLSCLSSRLFNVVTNRVILVFKSRTDT
jgi:hypothetical protein